MTNPEANHDQPTPSAEQQVEMCRRLNLDLQLLKIGLDLQEKAQQDIVAARNSLASGGYEFNVFLNKVGSEQEAHVTRNGLIVDLMPLVYRATEFPAVSPEVGFLEFANTNDKTTLYVKGFDVELLALDSSDGEGQENEPDEFDLGDDDTSIPYI